MADYLGPYASAGAPSNGTDEVQTIARDATVDGGTFALAFRAAPTGALAWDISAANLQVALRALYQVGGANLTVTGDGAVETPWTVTFIADLGKRVQPLLTVADNSLLAGEDAVPDALTIAEATPGVTATQIGAAKGAILSDVTNGLLYQNQGTKASPTWVKVGTQS